MPCRDDGPPRDDEGLRAELDRVTDMLCGVMRLIEMYYGEGAKKLFGKHVDKNTVAWWLAHKKTDRARAQREAAEREAKAARNRALSKLTPDERALLQLPDPEEG